MENEKKNNDLVITPQEFSRIYHAVLPEDFNTSKPSRGRLKRISAEIDAYLAYKRGISERGG